jgi:hypothetical protein
LREQQQARDDGGEDEENGERAADRRHAHAAELCKLRAESGIRCPGGRACRLSGVIVRRSRSRRDSLRVSCASLSSRSAGRGCDGPPCPRLRRAASA